MIAPTPAEGRIAPARDLRAGGAGSRAAVVLGAAAAAIASAGLMFWIGAARDPTLGAPPLRVEAPVGRAYAPSRADAAEIIRAHEQLKDVYAEAGLAGVARFGRACAEALALRPQTLDFCISFNDFARSLEPKAARVGGLDDLALVRAALAPGQDAAARLAQIRLLAREVGLKDSPGVLRETRIPAAPESGRATVPAAPHAGVAKASVSKANVPKASVSKARAAKARAACRRRAPAAPRTVCAAPALRSADLKLRAAYQRAAAAGVNPSTLGREQRQFRRAVQNAAPDRAAVARLYARRIRALEAQAQRARH